jgi:hypothetical protein
MQWGDAETVRLPSAFTPASLEGGKTTSPKRDA